jgi:capsular polysaccharide biosynthesis protein/MinD-like ATPase involved in chromosome partitioning or flagellar assembly
VESTETNDGGDLRQLLSLLWRRTPVILLAIVIGAGAAYGISKLQKEKYKATATLLFRALSLDQQVTGTPLQSTGDPSRDATTDVKLVSLDVVRERAARSLGQGYTARKLSKIVEISSDGQSDLVKVNATAPNADEAPRIANTVASSYVIFRKTSVTGQIQNAIDTMRTSLSRIPRSQRKTDQAVALRLSLAKLRLLKNVTTSDAQLVQPAQPPTRPSSPRPLRNSAIGAFVGLIIGLALALVVEQLDRRIRRTDQLEEVLGLPVLAQVPRRRALSRKALRLDGSGWLQGRGPLESEPFRRLRANLRYYGGEQGVRSVLMTSADTQSGKTTVALQLSAAAASVGARVLLIEADLRRPQLAGLIGAEGHEGLGTLLASGAEINDDTVVTVRRPTASAYGTGEAGHDDDGTAFDVLLAGRASADASELLDSDAMRRVMDWAYEHYDFIVVDGPPPGLVSDSIPLMRQVDGVIVVGRLGRDSRAALNHLRLDLQRLKVEPVGAVANFARSAPKSNYYMSA